MNKLYALIQTTENTDYPGTVDNIIAYSFDKEKLTKLSVEYPSLRDKAFDEKCEISLSIRNEYSTKANLPEDTDFSKLRSALIEKGLEEQFRNDEINAINEFVKGLGYALEYPNGAEEFHIIELPVL